MAAVSAVKKFKNISTGSFAPVPQLEVAPLPARLMAIDPAGCAAWQEQQRQMHATWIDAINTLNQNIENLLKQ